jgi:hypothetical protein
MRRLSERLFERTSEVRAASLRDGTEIADADGPMQISVDEVTEAQHSDGSSTASDAASHCDRTGEASSWLVCSPLNRGSRREV